MNTRHYLTASTEALLAAVIAVAMLATGFFVIEPQVGQSATSGPFTIKQVISSDISFSVDASNVTLTGPISGLTGGTGNGSTTAVVRTNNSDGYEMTIAFFDNGTAETMMGDASDSTAIKDYPSGGEPTLNYSTATTAATFGYTVGAAESSDLDGSFLNNSTNCNTGSTYTADTCWMQPATTSFLIIDRGTQAPTGATTTLYFRVYVPNNPSPSVVEDTYTATATLTALTQ